ncbi:MAG: PilT protein domain protein [Parcubacteria group bacterium Gr01-1014_33]|nr:MAG: PilT protein domain protein [Parcubacteria group bacterium Gr01-1014_33]
MVNFVYTLDTNTIIYYLKSEEETCKIVERIYAEGEAIYVSTITEAELFAFSRLDKQESDKIDTFLRTVSIILLDSRIARLSGSLQKEYGLKLADSAIAATALFTGSTLVTRNIRDFKKIPELKLREA